MSSFNEWAAYATYYSENPTKDPNAGGAIVQWITQIEDFAPFIEEALGGEGIPASETNVSNSLVLAFLFRNGTLATRCRMAVKYLKRSGQY